VRWGSHTAHGTGKMIICAGLKLLRLAVKSLHHQRIKDADLQMLWKRTP
jgi:hypothetical protein